MHFLKVSDYEYLFVCLLAICMSSSENCLFFKLDFCVCAIRMPYIFWILTPYQIDGLSIFSLSCSLTFNFADGFLCRAEAL